ncbi:MAG: hypothetical protein IPK04_14075 [Bdellovibrionales bacterium]|nr:hypothetical protein [Bdellovibrionales bacterium]
MRISSAFKNKSGIAKNGNIERYSQAACGYTGIRCSQLNEKLYTALLTSQARDPIQYATTKSVPTIEYHRMYALTASPSTRGNK